jgi:hypothetical protein
MKNRAGPVDIKWSMSESFHGLTLEEVV